MDTDTERITELEGVVADKESYIAAAQVRVASIDAEIEAAHCKIAVLEKQCAELAEQVATHRAARQRAERCLADPSACLDDVPEELPTKSRDDLLAEYSALADLDARAAFRSLHGAELGI